MQPNGNQPNPGSFMGGNGAGSALMRLMQLRQQGATPQQTANPVTPAQPPTGVGGPPRIMGAPPQGDVGGTMSISPQNIPQGVGGAQSVQPPTTPDDNLQIALAALGNYIKAHGEAHMAKSGVPQAKAHAAVIQARNNNSTNNNAA